MAGKPGEKIYGGTLGSSRCAFVWWATWYDPLTIEEGVHPARSTESGQGTIRDHLPKLKTLPGSEKSPVCLTHSRLMAEFDPSSGFAKGKAQLTSSPS